MELQKGDLILDNITKTVLEIDHVTDFSNIVRGYVCGPNTVNYDPEEVLSYTRTAELVAVDITTCTLLQKKYKMPEGVPVKESDIASPDYIRNMDIKQTEPEGKPDLRAGDTVNVYGYTHDGWFNSGDQYKVLKFNDLDKSKVHIEKPDYETSAHIKQCEFVSRAKAKAKFEWTINSFDSNESFWLSVERDSELVTFDYKKVKVKIEEV